MRGFLSGRGCLLAPALLLALSGCNENSPAPPRLVQVQNFNTQTGQVRETLQVGYPDPDTAVLIPLDSTGAPRGTYKQTCRFLPAGTAARPAVTSRYMVNGVSQSLTGKILLEILGLPHYVESCQAYFPDRVVAGERFEYPNAAANGDFTERVTISRGPDGVVEQRHYGPGVAEFIVVTGVDTYNEGLRYVSEGGRVTGYIYGAEAWPTTSYADYSGVVWDLYLFGALSGLIGHDGDLFVSPAAGHAVRFEYDSQGRLAAEHRYSGWGTDETWLTGDDVADFAGLTRYTYSGSGLASIERGLDPATGLPTPWTRREAIGFDSETSLPEWQVRDDLGRLVRVRKYESPDYVRGADE